MTEIERGREREKEKERERKRERERAGINKDDEIAIKMPN